MAKKTIPVAVRELLLSFPDVDEVISHGSPNFRVAGKTFATFTVNHHGDGRVALNVASPPGAQQLHTENEPEYFFVPPYVGPKGWLGMELNGDLDWGTIANRVREAWENIAPKSLVNSLGDTPSIGPPTAKMSPQQIDPFLKPAVKKTLERLRTCCDGLPETTETTQFGNPTWKAGKKTYVTTHHYRGSLCMLFWVGVDQQSLLTMDERYRIPMYMGHNGWIELDVEKHVDWAEVESLLHNSYRHFALKRMLKALDS